MRRINFEEPQTDEWKKWRINCKRATKKLIDKWVPGLKWKINRDLYKKMKKPVYFKKKGPFHGKCAYCETSLGTHDDLDHFRPAKGVTSIDFKAIDHPGYYWLAYYWRNLLPTCKDCNSIQRIDDEDDKADEADNKIGKQNRFPVKGFRAKKPGEEIKETPLIINPIEEYPEKQFYWDDQNGLIQGKTKKANICIKVFGFHERENLIEDWRTAHKEVMYKLSSYINPDIDNGDELRLKLIESIRKGCENYSFVKLAALDNYKQTTKNI